MEWYWIVLIVIASIAVVASVFLEVKVAVEWVK